MPNSLIVASRKILSEETESHHDLLLAAGFEHKGNGKYVHPQGHEAQISPSGAELKGRTWAQSAPGHPLSKVFKKQIERMLGQKPSGGPKAGQSAMPDSKGRYHNVK